jgi:hypothetical protein
VEMILFSNNFANSTACVFTDTLNKFPIMPKIKSASPKWNTVVFAAHPMFTKHNGYSIDAILSILLLPYLEVKLPEIGIPINEPNGRNNSIPPNCASVNPRANLMSGILLAQLAKQMPV